MFAAGPASQEHDRPHGIQPPSTNTACSTDETGDDSPMVLTFSILSEGSVCPFRRRRALTVAVCWWSMRPASRCRPELRCAPSGPHARTSTVRARGLTLGRVNEDASHRFRDGGEEVPTTVELLITNKSKIRLMNQGGGIERVTGFFMGHLRRRQLPQLVLHKRQQLGCRLAIASLSRFEKFCDVGHVTKHNARVNPMQ